MRQQRIPNQILVTKTGNHYNLALTWAVQMTWYNCPSKQLWKKYKTYAAAKQGMVDLAKIPWFQDKSLTVVHLDYREVKVENNNYPRINANINQYLRYEKLKRILYHDIEP